MSITEPLPDVGHRISIDWDEGTVTATRKLRESGGSHVVTVPPEIMDALNLEADDDLIMVADRTAGTITIQKAADQSGTESDDV